MASTANADSGKELAANHVYETCVKQRDICQELLDKEKQSGGSGVPLLQKALLSAELALGLLRMKNVDREKAFMQLLQKHLESVLDSTFHLENGLADHDFPQETCIERMKDIITQINSAVQFIQTNSEISKVLSMDTMECLHWRPGALMYMYCCTVMNDTEQRQTPDTDAILRECCRIGVAHFQELFRVHSPAVAEGGEHQVTTTTNDQNVAQLLEAGIRSDTHMLALAYGGELCYWYHQLTTKLSSSSTDSCTHTTSANCSVDLGDFRSLLNTLQCKNSISNDILDPIKTGTDFLTKYIQAAEGNMRLQSWNCDKPKQILQEFGKTYTQNV